MTTHPRSNGLSSAVVPRRLVLGGALAGLATGLTACSGTSLPIIGPADPDDQLRRSVAQSEIALIAAYDAAIAAFPTLAQRLGDFRDQHQAHLTAVSLNLDVGTASSPASPTRAPGGAASAVRSLRRLEAAAARDRIDACGAAADSDLAELLGRIAASESGHVAALRKGGVS